MGKSGSKLLAVEPNFDLSRLDEVPDDIRAAIERHISLQSDQIDELKSSYERLRVDSEQKCFELEKQLTVSNEKLQQESKSTTTLRQQVLELEKNFSGASQRLRETQDELFDATRILEELRRENAKVEAEKVELVEVLEKKNSEISTLTEEWKTFSVKLNETNQQRIEALAKVDEVETKSVTEQYQMSRLQQEMEHLRQQNEWLDGELREKTNQLLTVRKEKSSSVLELQAQLEEKTQEMAYLEETVQVLKRTGEENNVKIENYVQKLKESRELHTQIQEQYTHEVASQEKLLALYKEGASENEAKVSELTTAVIELQKHLKQASEAYTEIAAQRDKELEEASKVEQEKDEQITKLERELKDANDLLEAARKKGVVPLSEEGIEALSPSAAAASRLLKSGMTLTQEIEEKAPIMKAQREDYEHALQAVSQLTQQLNSAMLETEKLRVNTEEDSKRCREMTRANHRLQQQAADLSQQVRMLLKELEEARGRRVHLDISQDDQNVTCSDISSSSMVISDKLVTFRSIEELQEQNQKLLEVVRDLSEKLEERDTAVRDERTAELQARLDEAQEELKQMRESRERQTEMVSVVDVMVLSMPLTPGGRTTQPITSTPQTSADSPVVSGAQSDDTVDAKHQLTDTKNALKELQDQFNTYKREKADNDRMVSEQLEKFRQEASDLRVQNARLASQLEFSNERHKTLVSNIDIYKKEIAALRDKTQRYSVSVMKHEQTVSTQREDLLALQEKLSRAEVRCQSLEAHNAVLKSAETRLVQDRENILREKCSQNLLLANLQTIQVPYIDASNNLERAEFETKTKLTRQVESLRQENMQLQRKIDAAVSKNQTTITVLENRLGETRSHLEKQTAEADGTKRQIEELLQQIEHLKTQLAESTAMATASQSEPSTDTVNASVQQTSTAGSSPALEEEMKDLKAQLSQSATEVKGETCHQTLH
ncbi:hypothetical protein NP493_203g01012 [Ridgeia piscesae]|uniref:Nucleoprotein TPR n=1 Tax=Ridgeia piscesae TaxID=27915 RepID=A0AAD9P1C5_RIDPI|nr:hypothetical protein NP493_203g01012 [Ridgeia piscesae]